jgi:hypothetical protein
MTRASTAELALLSPQVLRARVQQAQTRHLARVGGPALAPPRDDVCRLLEAAAQERMRVVVEQLRSISRQVRWAGLAPQGWGSFWDEPDQSQRAQRQRQAARSTLDESGDVGRDAADGRR